MTRTRSSKSVILLFITVFLLACDLSFTGIEYRKGKKQYDHNNYKPAISHFKKVILRDPSSKYALESARLAARISFFETKQYTDAIDFYKHLIQYSTSEKERREAQGRIANIYFEKTVDYKKAITEYNKILLLPNSNEEIVEYRFNLARAHFYLNEFREAQSEIESALKISENKEKNFDLMMLLGNLFFNTKRGADAIKISQWLYQILQYPHNKL